MLGRPPPPPPPPPAYGPGSPPRLRYGPGSPPRLRGPHEAAAAAAGAVAFRPPGPGAPAPPPVPYAYPGMAIGHAPLLPLRAATPLPPHYAPLPYYPPTQAVPADHPDHIRHLTALRADAAAVAQSAGFESACARIADVSSARAAAAAHDTQRLAERQAVLSESVKDSIAATRAANHLMDRAVGIVDGCTYRTRYSPSSAYGPCGPYGPTSDFVSPYVAGVLHQR
eukprot:TRINITY_DN8101_c0_g6_i1.p1 TRINITY_DN8101_c0_g6~~TRINITY_DN8101_c0_g6_i1.p1  ORF type:complete len:255 (+),score=47.18 TRINITY_DN8101_c0_g6_i1:91-765(+)